MWRVGWEHEMNKMKRGTGEGAQRLKQELNEEKMHESISVDHGFVLK